MTPRKLSVRRHLGLPLFLAVSLSAPQGTAAKTPTPHSAKVEAGPPTIKDQPSELDDPSVKVLKRGVVLKVAQHGWADVQFTSTLPLGKHGTPITVENVHVSRGRVDGFAPSDGTAGVLLHGPGEVQVVTAAGHISMNVGPDRITVATIGGEALVGRSGALKVLPANTVRTFERKVPRFTDHASLPAPDAEAPGLGLSLGGETSVVLKVKNPDAAASYCGFLFDATGHTVARSCGQLDPSNIRLTAPAAGAYWASVAAVDAEGLAGALSQPAPVRILGLKDAEKDIQNGSVSLGAGEQLELIGYEGLMMRYGTSPEYCPATATVKTLEQKPTSIEFRNPQKPDDAVVLKLSPRLLKTRIDIGPTHSTWPQDEVKVSIEMWDGHGRPLDNMAEYQIVTKVGISPVQVPFTQQGSALVGVVPPQAGPGPWVVRVSVMDAKGREVKRNFLEVARPEPTKATTARHAAPTPGDAKLARR